MEPEDDWQFCKVVVNAEGQYAIWRADRENPLGWQDVGVNGTKEECLAYIKQVSKGTPPPGGSSRPADPDSAG